MRVLHEMVQEALRQTGHEDPNIQPSVLMHKNIDHDDVEEYNRCFLNDDWAPKIKELIEDGWITFRIQTELSLNGHETYIYLAKMK